MTKLIDDDLLAISKYEFDTFGFCYLRNFVSLEKIDHIKNIFRSLKKNNGHIVGTDVCLGQEREDGTLFISNIADADKTISDLAFDSQIISRLDIFMQNDFKLNHSNAIISNSGSTYPHMAGLPIHNKAFYHHRGDQILSSLTKLVLPISNNEADDGGFAAIKGSHKANYEIPFPKRSKEEYSLLEHIPIKLGDAILFTEAMTHGSLVNVSGKTRNMLFFCYSMSYMPNWSTQKLVISDSFRSKLSSYQKLYV